MSVIKAVLLDTKNSWASEHLHPRGGWIAYLSCWHICRGKKWQEAPDVGMKVFCLQCRREQTKEASR